MDCVVAVMAYNEQANIARLLEALLAQRLTTARIAEIVVVASGCTDKTEAIVLGFAQRYPHIRLIRQPRREGKASAINLCKRHTGPWEVIVLHSADVIPAPEAIEKLVAPFEDPGVGMVGARPVPANSPRDFMGYAAHFLWALHHRVSLHRPKMGEVIAFRNVFRQIPYDSAVDEASIEPLILGQGLQLRYAPEAIVFNRGPRTVHDFIKQRRRIYAGHLYVKDMLGYSVSTMNVVGILVAIFKEFFQPSSIPAQPNAGLVHIPRWRHLVWGPLVILLEGCCRLLSKWDYGIWKHKPFVWQVAETTKDPIADKRVGA